jgi:hypothetical protein
VESGRYDAKRPLSEPSLFAVFATAVEHEKETVPRNRERSDINREPKGVRRTTSLSDGNETEISLRLDI